MDNSEHPTQQDHRAVAAIEAELVGVRHTMSTLMARLLDLIAELDTSPDHPTAYADAASWMSWSLGMSGRMARRWVRYAHRLRDLPIVHEALATGALSFEQVSELMKVADVEDEAVLVDLARACGSVDELIDKLAEDRSAAKETAEPDPDPVRLTTWWQDDRLHLKGHITGADGVVVEHALQRLSADAPREPNTGLYRDPGVRDGESLVQMASEALAADGDHDRATIVVHIPAVDLVNRRGSGWDAASRIFTSDELDRLACDGRLQPSMTDAHGTTIGIGRVSRKIPPWLRRAMDSRDRGCRFPGCARTRWLHGHHIVQWAHEGPTNLDNLVSLCGFHHRMIHNEGWTITGTPDRDLTFLNTWGRVHTPPDRDRRWDDLVGRCVDQAAERRMAAFAHSPP